MGLSCSSKSRTGDSDPACTKAWGSPGTTCTVLDFHRKKYPLPGTKSTTPLITQTTKKEIVLLNVQTLCMSSKSIDANAFNNNEESTPPSRSERQIMLLLGRKPWDPAKAGVLSNVYRAQNYTTLLNEHWACPHRVMNKSRVMLLHGPSSRVYIYQGHNFSSLWNQNWDSIHCVMNQTGGSTTRKDADRRFPSCSHIIMIVLKLLFSLIRVLL